MRDGGLEYDRAHEIASALEFDLRKGQGLTKLLVSGGRKIGKSDLPGLTDEAVYEFVNAHYRRAGTRTWSTAPGTSGGSRSTRRRRGADSAGSCCGSPR